MKKQYPDRIRYIKCLRGSFSIEASIIVPLIIFGLVGLIWVVFYLRNSIKGDADADMMIYIMEQDAAKNRYKDHSSNAIMGKGKGYYGLDEMTAEVKRDDREIIVKLNISHRLPKEGILGNMIRNIREINIEKNEKIPDPSEIARIIKAAGGLIESIRNAVK